MQMQQMLAFALARGQEKSTWAGILTFVSTMLGVHFAPQQADAIAMAGTAVAAAIAVFTKERKPAAPDSAAKK